MLSNDETFYILKLYQREKLVDQSKVFCRKYSEDLRMQLPVFRMRISLSIYLKD